MSALQCQAPELEMLNPDVRVGQKVCLMVGCRQELRRDRARID